MPAQVTKPLDSSRKFFETLRQPRFMGAITLATAGVAWVALRTANVSSLSEIALTTEQAVSAFGLLAGVGGAASQIVAGSRMSGVDGGIVTLGQLAIPLAISISASTASAFLLPDN